MRIVIEINCDNAAFDNGSEELGRILRRVSDRLKRGAIDLSLNNTEALMDVNGNKVGSLQVLES